MPEEMHLREMKSWLLAGAMCVAGAGAGARMEAQAAPTATAALQFTAFAGATGTFTGVGLGKNLGVTAGGDVTFRPFFTLYPSLEIRGTYPVDDGSVDAQKNFMGGLRLGRRVNHGLEPYGDLE